MQFQDSALLVITVPFQKPGPVLYGAWRTDTGSKRENDMGQSTPILLRKSLMKKYYSQHRPDSPSQPEKPDYPDKPIDPRPFDPDPSPGDPIVDPADEPLL